MTRREKALVVVFCLLIGLIIMGLADWAEAVEPVTAYRTTDGSVYLTKDDAVRHEMRPELIEFVVARMSIHEVCEGSLVSFILRNRKELCEFLSTWEDAK